jgi:hypothetical protein
MAGRGNGSMSDGARETPPGAPTWAPMDRGSKIQMIAVVAVTLAVMVLGVLVVAFPHQFGLPGRDATPAAVATPAAP